MPHTYPKKKLAFFLDFDGTLAEVRPDPATTTLSPKAKETLLRLSKRYPVAMVSGRGLDDLRAKVAIPELTYVGNHGMQIHGGCFSFTFDIGRAARAALKEASALLRSLVSGRGGMVLEDKGFSLSLHFKGLTDEDEAAFTGEVEMLLARIAAPLNAPPDALGQMLLHSTGGRKIYEVRTRHLWNKGSAVQWLLERKLFYGRYPVYIGDDLTDADAFTVIRGRGLSISVGRDDLGADFSVEGAGEVVELLASLAERRER